MNRALNYIYGLATDGMDDDKREQFDILLTSPPVVAKGRALPAAAVAAEGDSFLAFQAAVTGRVQ